MSASELFARTCLEGLSSVPASGHAALAAALREKYAHACEVHVGVTFEPAALAQKVALLLGRESEGTTAALERLNLADLALASACLSNDTAALARLERLLERLAESVLRVMKDEDATADVLQQLRVGLLSTASGMAPRLARYEGRAPLLNWLKTLALHDAITATRRRRPDEGEDSELLEAMAAEHAGPELRSIQHENAAAVKRAFSEALLQLSPRDRVLLRLRFVQNLELDEIARFCGLHRSTVTRNLSSLAAFLFAEVRSRLKSELHLGSGSVDSMLRFSHGGVELSLERLLKAVDGEKPK